MNNCQVLLSIKNLSICTDSLELLKDYNLELNAGEWKGISAPTGTGKTTLFNYIAGILPPNTFKITGELKKAEGLKIAYAFQEPRLIPSINVLQNIMLPLKNIIDKESAASNAQMWLEKFNLLNKAYEFPNKLSGGEQQRANLARAFAYSAVRFALPESKQAVPEHVEGLLLLDEPFASQDEENALNIKKLINEQIQLPQTAALVISHDKSMLQQICSQVYEL